MSLITNKQQELIDTAISSFIQTNDNVSSQYSKLRADIIELSRIVTKEVDASGKISDETSLKLHQLTLEHQKFTVQYPSYLEKLSNNLDSVEREEPLHLAKLEEKYNQLDERNKIIKERINQVTNIQKPIVDSMNALTNNFKRSFSGQSKDGHIGNTVALDDDQSKTAEHKIDYQSIIFSKEELQSLFNDVNVRLSTLKTVDEVDEGKSQERDNPNDKTQRIDLLKYLDDILQNSRSFKKLEEDSYSFDITKSMKMPADKKFMTVGEYEQAEKIWTDDIEDLVHSGATAKERWLQNYKKLQAMSLALQSSDDQMEMDT